MSQFFFNSLAADHLPLLHRWMQEPHVSQYWNEGKSWSLQDIEEKYSSYILGYKISQGEKKAIFPFVIQFGDRLIGFIQMYNAFDFAREGFHPQDIWDEPRHSLGALDFYIGEPGCIDKGLGSECLKAFLRDHVFQLFDACLVDPKKNNKIAIKTYAKAGFSTLHEWDTGMAMIARKEEKKDPLIIFGSSRSDGNTLQAIKAVIKVQYRNKTS
jgi:RimJ/RimL family protein N-acetyltransferase